MDFTTPRTAIHSVKESFINSHFGKPIQRKQDGAAHYELSKNRINGEMPSGIQSVIDGVTNFNNKIKI